MSDDALKKASMALNAQIMRLEPQPGDVLLLKKGPESLMTGHEMAAFHHLAHTYPECYFIISHSVETDVELVANVKEEIGGSVAEARTDVARLNWLERQGGSWICRQSEHGRGWRLHQTEKAEGTFDSPRQAIDNAMANSKDYIAERTMSDGRLLHVLPLSFGRARLLLSTPEGFKAGAAEKVADYDDPIAAVRAMNEWTGLGDPLKGKWK